MFETERLLLRRFHAEDWRDLYEYLSQKEVVQYEPYDVFTENECRQEAITRSNNESFWAVCLQQKVIGNVYLAKQDYNTWELGFVFNAHYQKKGYATEAARALVDHVFRHEKAHRVMAMCNPLNESSWHLLERLGMRREGHLRNNIYFKKNQAGQPLWADTFMYAVLDFEWLSQSE